MSNPRKVILNMLITRGYLIENHEEFINSEEEEFLITKIDDENKKIYVFFPKTSTKVGVFTIRQYIKEMQDNNVDQSIVIVKDEITAFAKKVFIEAKPLIIECFKENELFVDKLNHVFVPKHELISEDEKKELYKVYKLKDGLLPKILSTDAITRYFGARKGQVFKITRDSESSGDYIYYRIVA